MVQFAREPIGPGRVRGEGLHIFDCHGQAIAFLAGRQLTAAHCLVLAFPTCAGGWRGAASAVHVRLRQL